MLDCRKLIANRKVAPQTRPAHNRKLLRILASVVVAGWFTAACSGSDDKPEYEELPAEPLYDKGVEHLLDKNYTFAAERFNEVERQHPYSTWATRAQLMSAYAYYQVNDYGQAIGDAQRFLALHPGHRDAPYAYYLIAMSYYEQISDVQRDQEMTQRAKLALEELVRRYPRSDYSRDARVKLELTRDHLAGKEMAIGRYYLRRKQYVGALNRFRTVITNYQTTTQVPEALHRLVETYIALGLHDEARKAAAVLGHNFPNSEWYLDSYKLAVNVDQLDVPVLASDIRKGEKQDSLLDRLRKNIF